MSLVEKLGEVAMKGLEEAAKHPDLLELIGNALLGGVDKTKLVETIKAEMTMAARDKLEAELEK